jgi:hypothetical protein
MKKLFTLLILLGGVVLAQAADYDLMVAGVVVTDANKNNITGSGISGKVTYNSSSKTLFLAAGTKINTSSDGIHNGIDGLSIRFEGDVTITTSSSEATAAAIFCAANTTLTKLQTAPSFNVVLKNTGKGNAIRSYQGGNIDIWSLRITAEAANNDAVRCNDSYPASMKIHYAKLEAKAGSGYAAFKGFTKGITLSDGLSVCSYSFDATKGGFVDSSNQLLKDCIIYPAIDLGGVNIGSNEVTLTTTNTLASSASGTVKLNASTKTLTLTNVNIDGATINCRMPDLKIVLSGDCSVKNNNTVLNVRANTSISGNYNLTLTSTNGSAISTFYSSNLEMKLIQLQAKGAGYGFYGQIGGKLTLKKATDDTYYKFSGTNNGDIFTGSLIMDGVDFSTPNTYWNNSDYFVYYNDAISKSSSISGGSWIASTSKINYLDLYVAGTHVRENCTKYITSPNMTAGTVSYDTSTKTLKLNGVTIKLTESAITPENCGIYHKYNGFIIETSGTNNITTAYEALQLGGNTTIKGNGTFNLTSTESHAIEMLNDGGLTLMRSGGVMAAKGAKYGYYGYNDTYLTIQKDGSNGGLYKFVGAKGNIHNTLVKFGEGVGLHTRYTWYNKDEFCYYNQYSEAKGTTLDEGTWIRCDLPLQKYGVFVGGDEITGFIVDGQLKGPAWGFCNKYYKGSGISYDPSSKTLTLNGVTLDVGSDFVNAIRNTNDGLTIKVTGTNVLTSSHSGYNSDNVPINVSANTTITGDGSLKVEKLPVSTYSNANLTLKDAKNLEFHNIKANTSSSTSKLLVDNSNVTINNSTSYFANVSWQNGFLHLPKDGYFDSEIRKIVDSYGNAATKVVFGDKTTAGIDGITTDADAEVIGIYDAQGRKLEEMQQGINIIRMSDGTTKKVIRK